MDVDNIKMNLDLDDVWRVESFGRDCLGNISGYCIVRGYGWRREIVGQFCGDIYETGSFDRAYQQAAGVADRLNVGLTA